MHNGKVRITFNNLLAFADDITTLKYQPGLIEMVSSPLTVFISYNQADKVFAGYLATDFKTNMHLPIIQHAIGASQKQVNLRTLGAMIIVLSKHYTEESCTKDIEIAIENDVPLFPVIPLDVEKHEGTEPLYRRKSELYYIMGKYLLEKEDTMPLGGEILRRCMQLVKKIHNRPLMPFLAYELFKTEFEVTDATIDYKWYAESLSNKERIRDWFSSSIISLQYEAARRFLGLCEYADAQKMLTSYYISLYDPKYMEERLRVLESNEWVNIEASIGELLAKIQKLPVEDVAPAVSIALAKIAGELNDQDREYAVRTSRISDTVIESDQVYYMKHVFRNIIDELNRAGRASTNKQTKYEQMLKLFINSESALVPFDDILSLFENTSNPQQAAWAHVNSLNKRLEEYDLRVEKQKGYDEVTYGVTSIKPIKAQV